MSVSNPARLKPSKTSIMKDHAYNKRHHIVAFGLPEQESPEADFREVVKFFKKRMGLYRLNIDVVYRLGLLENSSPARPRPLIVTFSRIKDKWAIWNRRGNIRYVQDTPVWLQQDLPRKLRSDYRVLQRIAKVARQNPESYGDVRVRDFKVCLDGQRYSMDKLNLLPQELSLQSVYSPRSDEALVFFTRNSPFSNHFSSNFDFDGLSFSCVEQYLAVHRAYMSKDQKLARRAMTEHKAVLNLLRNDKREEWRDKAPDLIAKATRAKFTQNTALRELLESPYPLTLGEASKDAFWGSGLPLEHPDALDTSQWATDGNLMGKTLMNIREELMRRDQRASLPFLPPCLNRPRPPSRGANTSPLF